jgi:HlyD family secretion protein
MTANVKILIEEHPDVLKVPNAALRYHPTDVQPKGRRGASGQQAVWLLDANDRPRAVPVTLGLSDGTYTEVTGGNLKQGDRMIIASFGKKEQTTAAASPFGGAQSGGGRRGGGF